MSLTIRLLYLPVCTCLQQEERELGVLCRWLHLMAAVGLQPPVSALDSACTCLQQHERLLSKQERQWLQQAFETWEWGFERHGLSKLGSSGGGSSTSAVPELAAAGSSDG